jgi:hypothetical protein
MMQSAGARYRQIEGKRDPFLKRARDAAKLTIPALMPPDSHTGESKLPTPFQGLGARGLNNLSSKLLLALLPPNSPFFRLTIDDYSLEQMTQQEGMRAEVEEALGKIERAVQSEIETSAVRVTGGETLKQLLVAGNALLYLPYEGGAKMFRLDRYVVERDPMGNVLDLIVKESISPKLLPTEMREVVEKGDLNPDKTVDLFTRVTRVGNKWEVYQEVKEQIVPGTQGAYPLDKCPWIPLRFTKIDGEDYGRGYVEEYYGDLRSLESLTQAIVEGSAAASKVLFLVNPNGVTQQRTLSESPNGAVRTGDAHDVSVLQVEKFADFRIAFETIESISSRLSYAFLLNSAVQRGGERVTAEEIRYMASELEDALGGVYSILSLEFQLPLVKALMHRLEKQKRIPTLPKGSVRPAITTGLEALGRGHDLNKLDLFLQGVMQTFGPEVVSQYVNVGDYLTRRGTALGIDTKGLVKTQEEIEAEQQQAQEAAVGQMVAEGGMGMAQEMVKGAMKQ